MKKSLIAAALFAATVAHAGFLVMRTHEVSITLTENVCPAEVADNIKPEFKDKFHEAWMVLNGRPVLGCWIPHVEDPNIIVILTDSGQVFGAELKAFKKDDGV